MSDMSENNKHTVSCPFCETYQPIPDDMTDDVIFCQKCGNKFQPGRKGKDASYPIIGKLAVSYQYISEEQLKKALAIKQSNEEQGQKTTLEEILIKHEMLTPNQMKTLHKTKEYLELKKQDKKFAEMVVHRKPDLKSQVEKALGVQARVFKEKKGIRRLGDILVMMDAITPEERDAILKEQKNMGKPADRKGRPRLEKESVSLVTSEDGMQATLRIIQNPAPPLTVKKVKHMLEEKKIAFGIVNDYTIRDFLTKSQTPRELEIAVGNPVIAGKDAALKLFFDESYLSAGVIDEEGNIDFKNRGDIPFVKTGDLLAEKKPMKEGSDGIDIYGNTIIAEPVKDIELSCGAGARSGDDDMSVFADTDGQPLLSFGGKISVIKEMMIKGDVDYNTGHVKFDGNVIVQGTIRNGFNVNSAGLKAEEISGGNIYTESDISISGGILDATIHARGNIYATYIKNSTISSCSNLCVKKEIIDSSITLGGFCQVESGSILSSSISAKKGIQSVNIGSNSSKPNKLKIGVDDFIHLEIKRMDTRIDELKKTQKKHNDELQEYVEKLNVIHNMISEMSHEKNRISRDRSALDHTLQRFSKKKKQRNLSHAIIQLQEFDQKIKTIEETTASLLSEQDTFQEKKEKTEKKKQHIENTITDLMMEKQGMTDWSRQEEAVPVVRVSGTIFDRTVVSGRYAKIALKETYKNVHLKETKSTLFDGPDEFDIQIIQNTKK